MTDAWAWLMAPAAAPWTVILSADFPDTPAIAWRGPAGEWGHGTLADLPPAARLVPLRVATPPIETVLMTSPWPAARRAQLAQALPYLLEDQLLTAPQFLSFSYHENAAGVDVAITSAPRVVAWQAAFTAHGLAARFCPLSLVLPWLPNHWSCHYRDGQWAVRTGFYSGLGAVGRADRPPAALVHALAEAQAARCAPSALQLVDGDDAQRAMLAQALAIPVIAAEGWAAPAAMLPFALGEGSGVWLPAATAALRALRPACVAGGLWLVLNGAYSGYEGVALTQALAHLQDEQARIFATHFPGVPILDAATQMRAGVKRLTAAGGGTGFLGLITTASAALAALPPSSLTGLQYRHGSLIVVLRLPNFRVLAALNAAWVARGLVVTIGRVVSRADGVRARIRLRRPS